MTKIFDNKPNAQVCHIFPIVTVRNEVAKVMFLQASVCPQGGGWGCLSQCMVGYTPGADIPRSRRPPGADTPPEQTHPLEQTPPPGSRHHPPGVDTPQSTHPPPPPRDGHCCGRYGSYWNAFLFITVYVNINITFIF